MWNLLLRFSNEAIHAVLYSIVEDNSLIYRRFPLDTTVPSRISAIENTIYDNPALLSDFRSICCIVETREYAAVPAICTDKSALIFKESFPESRSEPITDASGLDDVVFVAGIEPELRGFINRTFHNAQIRSHISSLSRYFALRAGQGNSIKMLANMRASSLDVIVTDGRRLLLANTFSFNTVDDAAYYLLACRKSLNLDPYADEMLLAGNQSVREKLSPVLRTYLARVMPVIFPPQMFRAGKDAMLAPFDLITAPLCD